MQYSAPHPVFDKLALAFTVVLLAGLATFAEVKQPWKALDTVQLKSRVDTTQPAAVSKPPAKAVAAAPAPKPAVKTAATISFVHMRSAKSTTSPIVVNIEPGTQVELREDSDVKWQGVTYKGKPGYIFKAYLQY